MMNNLQQVLPGFTVSSDAGFDNFYTPPALQLVKDSLMQLAEHPAVFVYLCGVAGTGKSHLLQAVCNLANSQDKTALYLPLQQLKAFSPADIFDNANAIDVLCLDDIDAITGDAQWEKALFHLYNERLMAGRNMVFAAGKVARELDMALPDLQTRLSACTGFQLPVLSDVEKAGLIQFRARLTGMEINDVCMQYIIHHNGRHLSDLVNVLKRLDQESLVAGRKITVPFIKAIFQW